MLCEYHKREAMRLFLKSAGISCALTCIGLAIANDPTFKIWRGAHIHMIEKERGEPDKFVGWAEPRWYGSLALPASRLHNTLEPHHCDGFYVDNAGYGVQMIVETIKPL